MSKRIVQLNEEVIKGYLKELVRGSVPQCVLCNTSLQGKAGGKDAQGDPRPGKQKSGPGESQSCGGATALYEAERGRQEGGGWH